MKQARLTLIVLITLLPMYAKASFLEYNALFREEYGRHLEGDARLSFYLDTTVKSISTNDYAGIFPNAIYDLAFYDYLHGHIFKSTNERFNVRTRGGFTDGSYYQSLIVFTFNAVDERGGKAVVSSMIEYVYTCPDLGKSLRSLDRLGCTNRMSFNDGGAWVISDFGSFNFEPARGYVRTPEPSSLVLLVASICLLVGIRTGYPKNACRTFLR